MQSSSPFAGRRCKMEINVKVMVWINAPKAGIVGFTIFPGISRESLKIPEKFLFPGNLKIWENRHHYIQPHIDSALSQNKLEPIPPCANTFGTYSTLRILHWDLFHLCNISSGTYSTFWIFQVGPIPQSQKSFWDLFHSLNFFFKHHGWNRSQLEVEKVPIILGPIPPPIGTYSTLKLCGTNSTLRKKWDLFHRFNWDLVHL